VTVPVPRFYRVVWVDAPPYARTDEYPGYDMDDVLAVTGRVYLWGTNSRVKGTRDFQLAPGYTENVGPQIGTGPVNGGGD
jgi:hypothetical protein